MSIITKMKKWLGLQTQRLREQGVRQSIHAALKKILRRLISPWVEQLHELPRVRKALLRILKFTGLNARIKGLLNTEPTQQVIHLSARALEIRQELKRVLDRLENAQ